MTEDTLPPAPPAEAAAPDFTQSPEFRDAVSQAADDAVARIMAQLAPAGAVPTGSPESFAQGLAMAIAQLTDQGTGRKRVAPEIVQARTEARKRMEDLIAIAREKGDVPRYRLVAQVYLDEVKVDPKWIDSERKARDTVIEWPGVPSEAMRPENDVAKAIYDEFIASIGSTVAPVKESPTWITPSGLVVHGRGQLRRSEIGQAQASGPAGEGLRIPHKGQSGQYQPINVLGSVAAPAVQSA